MEATEDTCADYNWSISVQWDAPGRQEVKPKATKARQIVHNDFFHQRAQKEHILNNWVNTETRWAIYWLWIQKHCWTGTMTCSCTEMDTEQGRKLRKSTKCGGDGRWRDEDRRRELHQSEVLNLMLKPDEMNSLTAHWVCWLFTVFRQFLSVLVTDKQTDDYYLHCLVREIIKLHAAQAHVCLRALCLKLIRLNLTEPNTRTMSPHWVRFGREMWTKRKVSGGEKIWESTGKWNMRREGQRGGWR